MANKSNLTACEFIAIWQEAKYIEDVERKIPQLSRGALKQRAYKYRKQGLDLQKLGSKKYDWEALATLASQIASDEDTANLGPFDNSPEGFIRAWQTSNSIREVAEKTGLKNGAVRSRGLYYQIRGIPLKGMRINKWEELDQLAIRLSNSE